MRATSRESRIPRICNLFSSRELAFPARELCFLPASLSTSFPPICSPHDMHPAPATLIRVVCLRRRRVFLRGKRMPTRHGMLEKNNSRSSSKVQADLQVERRRRKRRTGYQCRLSRGCRHVESLNFPHFFSSVSLSIILCFTRQIRITCTCSSLLLEERERERGSGSRLRRVSDGKTRFREGMPIKIASKTRHQ